MSGDDALAGMHHISVSGTDGSEWTYMACSGRRFVPQEIGWILLVEGSRTPIEPQMLTVEEVVGDLKAMLPDDESHLGLVEPMTRWMISDLREGRHAPASVESVERRLSDLESEYERAFPDGPQTD